EAGSTSSIRMLGFALLAFGTLVAAIIAAMLHDEIRTAITGTMPLLGRYALKLLLPTGLAWIGLRFAKVRVPASGLLALALVAGFIVYAGLGQAGAIVLLLATSLLLGRALLGSREPPRPSILLTAMLAGLGVMAAITGWLLPVPMHSSALTVAVMLLVCFVGWRKLTDSAQILVLAGRDLVAAHPVASFASLAVLGFASILLWLPSLNPDDNSAHLLLANQLLADGYSRLDASTQISSVSPWLNNVVHALLALLTGAEARSANGLVWLLFGCAGAYRLARSLRADGTTALASMALYASHPLTAYYGTTLQVDGASAACLLHLAALCVDLQRKVEGSRSPIVIGAVCGMLAAMKITNLVYLAFFGIWLMWYLFRRGEVKSALVLLVSAAFVAGSSYFYAALVTGNPLFPLYNGIFKSPYMPPVDFADQRWHSGFTPGVLWDLTFSTGKYMEAYTGAAGLTLVALAGAGIVAVCSGGWRLALLLIAAVSGAIVFSQVQYLRYVYPAMALAGTVALVAMVSLGYRRTAFSLLAVLVVAQLGLVKTSNWIINAGVAEQMFDEGPKSIRRIEERFVPERRMIRTLETSGTKFCLLLADPEMAYVALAPGKSLTTAFYDSRMSSLSQWANQDASGQRWQRLLDSVGVTHIELRPSKAAPPLLAGMELAGFETTDTTEGQLWSRQGQSAEHCVSTFLASRDEAKRMFH
ncbi:MAG: hypothetical protein ABIW30_01300, partial [Arenimonas sp.]